MREAQAEQARRAIRICFPHVPKCAGVAVENAIRRQYSLKEKALTSSFRVNLRACQRAAEATSTPASQLRQHMLACALASPRNVFATGHVACKPQLVSAFLDEWRFITVLRDPVERWISNYVYDRHKTTDWAKVDIPVEEYLESERGRNGGMIFLRYFSSMEEPPPSGEHGRFVDEAEANLRRFAIVGAAENMAKIEEDFRRVFGRGLTIRRSNRTPDPGAKQKIKDDSKLLGQVREVCQPDIELYERFFAR